MNSKLTAESIIGEAMRANPQLSGMEFPISAFPLRIQRIITELHDSQGYPIDYIAAAMLSALAVSIGNSHLVQVKRGWLESPILYIALIGRPGASSSPVASFAMNCERTVLNSSKISFDFSRSICPVTVINTSAPRMMTTSITRRSTSPASNVALWATTATMELH